MDTVDVWVFCGLADLRWVFCGPTSAASSAKYPLVGPQVRKIPEANVIELLTEFPHCGCNYTCVCGQGMSNVFAAPPIKYFKIFYRLSIPNRNPNLKP